MGVDYINKIKLGWRKGWSRGREKLRVRQLFNSEPSRAQTIDVVPFRVSDFREGEPYEVQLEYERLFIYSQGRNIGVCNAPPRTLLSEVEALGGKTLGTVRTRGSNERVEVTVLLPSHLQKGASQSEHVSSKLAPLPQR
ncbi:MAG: hypothetical protein ABR568_09825 [Pyrinomonadaceae bacterium]